MRLTITEALAELKTIASRLAKKRQFVQEHAVRPSIARDPFEKDGGTMKMLASEMQGITDLESRIVRIRTAIQQANHDTLVTVAGTTKTLAEWLTWRKEIVTSRERFVMAVLQTVRETRRQFAARAAGTQSLEARAAEAGVEINVDEKALSQESETITKILGDLDGQLSLKNATVTIEIGD
jgi:hypothetical protein